MKPFSQFKKDIVQPNKQLSTFPRIEDAVFGMLRQPPGRDAFEAVNILWVTVVNHDDV
jgi:hypothetical protein